MQKGNPFDAFHDQDPFFTKVYGPITWDNIERFLPPPGGRILDAGGSGGRWAVRLARLGYQVTMTDISRGMIEVAREKLQTKGLLDRAVVQQVDIRDVDELPDDAFGLSMVQGDALSYCESAEEAVGELARVTRPGGHVIVSANSRILAVSPMAMGFWKEAERILHSGNITWQGDDAALPFPVHTFTVGELRSLFERHGLLVVRVLGKPVFFTRLSPETQRRILQDNRSLDRLIDLETRFGDDPAWAGSAARFEMVGVKEEDSSVQLLRKVWSK